MQAAVYAPIAAATIGWLWFLARGRASGALKRAALRLTLLVATGALLTFAAQRGLFVRTSFGFRVALLLALLTVAVGYLYLIRFCASCGRMVRNLREPACPRCLAFLPLHGMTTRLRRAGDDRRWNPLDRPQRTDGPRA